MDHVEGPWHIFLVGKERQPNFTCCISPFYFFSLSFVFYIGEEGFLLYWLSIGVYTYCATCARHASIGNLWRTGDCPNLSICFDNMKTSNLSVRAIEENIGFTNKLLMDFSHKKCSSKEFVYLIICLFVRN